MITVFPWNRLSCKSLLLYEHRCHHRLQEVLLLLQKQRYHQRQQLKPVSTTSENVVVKSNPSYVDITNAPKDYETEKNPAVVYNDFITNEEGQIIQDIILNKMKRRRYEKGHWDAVITKYKEIELKEIEKENISIQNIFDKIRNHLEHNHFPEASSRPVSWLPCHAIDLKSDGLLTAHVDSIRFSGDLVAGLSLMSGSIMRLKPSKDDDDQVNNDDDGYVDLYLPPLSLYALTGVARYKYTHELLPCGSSFHMKDDNDKILQAIGPIKRDQRISIIFRDAKKESDDTA